MATVRGAGKVFLVGAGPGDPGLITVKGLQCLRAADVVVYDRLAAPGFVDAAKPDAELIYCGKSPDRHELTQDQINQLLIEKAKEGRIVCRLKGGDPFVFGRGGEEALELHRCGIPYEIVPGVTSAIAAAAYAGIPVTHRGIATSFAVVTGHEDPSKPETQVDWQKLPTAVDTLVILMGVGHLPQIVASLTSGGRPADTPVAIVSWGTLPEQTTLLSTLGQIVQDAATAAVKPPSVIIVGEVTALRSELAWFDDRPLFGRRGLVTRMRHQASELSALLRQHGAIPIEMPVIQIMPPDSWEPVDRALEEMECFDWLVFTSVNSVTALTDHLAALELDIRALKGPRIAAIGPKTAAAAEAAGLRVSLRPDEYVAEALLEALAADGLEGKRILLLQAAQAREVLPDKARAEGAEVVVAAVYQTLPSESLDPEALRSLEHGEIDFVTFASSSTVTNFVQALGPERARALLENVCVACIGPITAATARDLGITPTVVPEEYTVEALVAGLCIYYSAACK
ncbi:MAG: uroporphyrinogen-III C-methyltransferase [Armatimonadota bacterium]